MITTSLAIALTIYNCSEGSDLYRLRGLAICSARPAITRRAYRGDSHYINQAAKYKKSRIVPKQNKPFARRVSVIRSARARRAAALANYRGTDNREELINQIKEAQRKYNENRQGN